MTSDRTRLRGQARAARRAFVAALAPAVRRVLEALLAERLAPLLEEAHIVGAHAPHGSEIDIRPALAGLSRPIAWPRALQDGGLSFHVCDLAQLTVGPHGVPEAPAGLPEVQPDVLLVPLLLFDREGNRLGQGGGHYDRTVARLREAGPTLAVGVAFDMQEAAHLEAAPWDAPLDAVATPSRFHWCQPKARPAP